MWTVLATLVAAQICYPLTSGVARAVLVVGTVAVGCALSVGHAGKTRGARVVLTFVGVTTGGGLLVEVVGVATGWPFGGYAYGDALGPKLLGVPLVVPLAWTWMAWPAWLAAGQLTARRTARVALGALALAGWDLFLDPQMVAAGYWHWTAPEPTLPGVPHVPVGNYLGWLGVSLVMMTALDLAGGVRASTVDIRADAPMLALSQWTYYASVLAHAVFLGLAGSALWGALVLGTVAVPLTVTLLARATPLRRASPQVRSPP